MPHLEWYYSDKVTHQIIVRNSTVNQDTMLMANWIASIGATRLIVHHAHNADDPRPDSSVSVSRGDVDAFANLNDPDGGATPIAKQLGIFAPYAFSGAKGPQALNRPNKKKGKSKNKKKLGPGYGKKK